MNLTRSHIEQGAAVMYRNDDLAYILAAGIEQLTKALGRLQQAA